jgi:hypothetical protein
MEKLILSYESAYGGILLKEVDSEEEAFAEMRRYIQINHIRSDYTTVQWKDDKPSTTYGVLPRHKEVFFGEMALFGIYYSPYKPIHSGLDTREHWGVDDEGINRSRSLRYNEEIHQRVCWYDELENYFNDLKLRSIDKKEEGGP